MLDELFDLFDRKKDRGRSGGLRGAIGRAIAGDDDRRDRDDRHDHRDDRRHRQDDDDFGRSSRHRRRDGALDFD